MSKIVTISIRNLCPTDQTLNLLYISYLIHAKNQAIPEIIKINNKNYIADGHHRIFVELLKQKSIDSKIQVVYHRTENSPAFDYFKDTILKKAEKIQRLGIKDISDLTLCGFTC